MTPPDGRRSSAGAGELDRTFERVRRDVAHTRWTLAVTIAMQLLVLVLLCWPRAYGGPIVSGFPELLTGKRMGTMERAGAYPSPTITHRADRLATDVAIETLHSLEETLVDFAGCAVVISHDRFFLGQRTDQAEVVREGRRASDLQPPRIGPAGVRPTARFPPCRPRPAPWNHATDRSGHGMMRDGGPARRAGPEGGGA